MENRVLLLFVFLSVSLSLDGVEKQVAVRDKMRPVPRIAPDVQADLTCAVNVNFILIFAGVQQ